LFEKEGDLVVGDNEPYHITDETDYGIPVHGERRGIPHVELEIRQDLIADARGQAAWAERLCRLLPEARSVLNGKGTRQPSRQRAWACLSCQYNIRSSIAGRWLVVPG